MTSPKRASGPAPTRPRVLVDAFDRDTALAWLFGENRLLDREAPAAMIRHAASESELETVVALAREFAAISDTAWIGSTPRHCGNGFCNSGG